LLSTDTGPGQAVVAVAGALGTALSGYIGKLFLTTYQLSVRQMSYYYLQPQITCYLLHAEPPPHLRTRGRPAGELTTAAAGAAAAVCGCSGSGGWVSGRR
jgi:hypothetical protein